MDLFDWSQAASFEWSAYGPDGSHSLFDSPLQAQPPNEPFTNSPDLPPAFQITEHQDLSLPSDTHISDNTMGPPSRPRKKKAPTLNANAWEPYKARIIELHVEQGRPLKEVKETIEHEFGFKAE
jgi:hypothetical protein